jgi:hypothetical protein
VERFILRMQCDVEVRKQYHLKTSNRFAVLENLNESEDINRACGNTKQNIKT